MALVWLLLARKMLIEALFSSTGLPKKATSLAKRRTSTRRLATSTPIRLENGTAYPEEELVGGTSLSSFPLLGFVAI